MDKISRLEKDIRTLAIQGATNIALATLEGILITSGELENGTEVYSSLKTVAERLAYVRPTEPLAQNAVRFIFAKPNQEVQYYLAKVEEYKQLIFDAKQRMADFGVGLIQNGGVYLTHCHSSTVVAMFIKAKKQGKRFAVYATETRPKYQGRTTVQELLAAGIEDVVLTIDDVAESIIEGRLKHIDAVFIGADLLSWNGFVNKVGSLGIAYSTKRSKIPLFCLSILLKYDPRPYSPKFIEKRSGDEIWNEAPTDLQFYAPAFDYIPYNTQVNIISEAGIMKGEDVAEQALKLYGFLS